MKKIEQFSAKNPNPVISVAKDRTVLYSNEAGEPLLHTWGVRVGEKLPYCIGDFVQKAISQNRPEKIEVKVGRRVYLISFHHFTEEEFTNLYGFDITDQKKLEEKLRIKEKQNDILYRIGKIALKYENLQDFLDESVKLIVSILEVEYCKILESMPDGNFLLRAGFGWKPGLVGKAIVEGEKESQAGYTLLSRTPVVVEDFEKESRFKKPEILRMHEVESGVSVTIGSIGNIFGVLGVHSTRKRKFTSDDTYFLSSVAFLIAQVIERKKAEEALKEAHNSLEEKIRERTVELETAYLSLKESERSLAEAQKMAHVGNWDINFITGESHWSEETCRIFGRSLQNNSIDYDEFLNYVHPDDRDYVDKIIENRLKGGPQDIDYRIVLANGEERIVHDEMEVIFDENNVPIKARGIVQDITERKKTEKALANLETARQKEIHHRVKNNLQVISSLLDLQAEKFNKRECIKDSEVLKAFRESQNRVVSIALIHEELYEGAETDKVDFSLYLQKLVENFFQTYRLGNLDISLKTDLKEKVFFDMDIAVPLGMVINELVTNSFKYAFTNRKTGEIQIKLFSEETKDEANNKNVADRKSTRYTLIVSDNGIGIPENVNFETPETLGLQLVNLLVDQLEGKVKLKRDKGTEFVIEFSVEEKVIKKKD